MFNNYNNLLYFIILQNSVYIKARVPLDFFDTMYATECYGIVWTATGFQWSPWKQGRPNEPACVSQTGL